MQEDSHVARDDLEGVAALAAGLDARLSEADTRLESEYPGARTGRQPVHSVYVPADRIHAGLAADWGRQALAALDEHAPEPADLATATGLSEAAVAEALPRVRTKLAEDPVEDLRVDLEDGYGDRGDETEDAHVLAAADALVTDLAKGQAPAYIGIRMKGMEAAGRHRGVRSLTLFLQTLLEGHGSLPDGLIITMPKINSVVHVEERVLHAV